MNESTKRLSRLSLLTAFGVALLYLGSVLPTVQLAVMAVASLLTAVTLMMYSAGWAAAVFAATAILALLILPEKGYAVFYTVFFGCYPILKSFYERAARRWAVWLQKFGQYCLSFILIWLLAKEVLMGGATLLPWYVMFPAGAVVFVVYDICLTFLIRFYIEKISGYIK